jgi:hypothetical protein
LTTAAALMAAALPANAQTGVKPIKVIGPGYITVISKAALSPGKSTIYHYTLTQSDYSSVDQVYTVTESGNHMSHASTVTVLAGHLTANINMTPFEAGYTTISVSNANGSASEDVTIDW